MSQADEAVFLSDMKQAMAPGAWVRIGGEGPRLPAAGERHHPGQSAQSQADVGWTRVGGDAHHWKKR